MLPWRRDRIFLPKDPITVGCKRKNPKHMRSNKEKTCVGKAIIGKGQMFVIFAVLDILQLVIQHWSGNCLTATGQGHIDNKNKNTILMASNCQIVILRGIAWYSMVFHGLHWYIDTLHCNARKKSIFLLWGVPLMSLTLPFSFSSS